MSENDLIRDLFLADVTRDISPVVHFHNQSPSKVAAEIGEYIITGGWNEKHPNYRRVPDGIHEQYVRLLSNIVAELEKPGGADLPNAWISGFYGSGKSSFAKILGLALNGDTLPDGRSVAEAWLARDTSSKAAELRDAWTRLRSKVDPIAVIFDIGAATGHGEHIHTAAVKQLQRRLAYCPTDPQVAEFELKLERDGEWKRFERIAEETLGKPWSACRERALAEEDFSCVMAAMFPERYKAPTSWFESRAGIHQRSLSPDEAVSAIRDMLRFRKPGATLFFVIDEVSQFVLAHGDRVERLRSFAELLGSKLAGKCWLLALGQQKMEEDADDSFLVKMKDRFLPRLRVHLAPTNIRDVVHKRLLQKKPAREAELRALFERNRSSLKLYAYSCEHVTPEEFVDFYPMLPEQVDLILKLTTALRLRSSRAQGDDQAIRGLLQLLGELFRGQKLAEKPVGALVTLDQIYEVQHTALDSDTQASLARIMAECVNTGTPLHFRVAKAVALLELIQETIATEPRLVAQCLCEHVECHNLQPAVTEVLEDLRRRNLLSYTEKHGYKIQSSAGEEWERERRDIGVNAEAVMDSVQNTLKYLIETTDKPKLESRPFPWAARFSDGRRVTESTLIDPRDDGAILVDFRLLTADQRLQTAWIKQSGESTFADRIVWVAGDGEAITTVARELLRSVAMVRRYRDRREALSPMKKVFLQQEENRIEESLEKELRSAVAKAWLEGTIYFRARVLQPADIGASFPAVLHGAAAQVLQTLFPFFNATQVQPSELAQLLVVTALSGPSAKFMADDLGLLEADMGQLVPSCTGVVPQQVLEYVRVEQGVSGADLLGKFARPPYGYTGGVVKACVAGLLRGSRVRIQPEGGPVITAVRDFGVQDLFDKDRAFRTATIFPAGDDDIGPQTRAKIAKFFARQLEPKVEREDGAFADAVATRFPQLAERLRGVLARLARLPGDRRDPEALKKLQEALERCLRNVRETETTVKVLKKHLDVLGDGVQILELFDAELTEEAITLVQNAHRVLANEAVQLRAIGVDASNVEAAATRIADLLAVERPWRDIASVSEDIEEIRGAYRSERRALLEEQAVQVEAARAAVKQREGFALLSADKSNRVLKSFTVVMFETSSEAIAPSLTELRISFEAGLPRAVDEANDALDELRSNGTATIVRPVELPGRNREIATEADVDSYLTEVRTVLLECVRRGERVRIR